MLATTLFALIFGNRQIYVDVLVRGVAQSGSALGWGPRCRWFKSSRPDHLIPSREGFFFGK